jgi:hypothetical protein
MPTGRVLRSSTIACALAAASVLSGATPDAAAPPKRASSPAPAGVPPPPALPPGLVALEQKMLALQLTSERFSASISIVEQPSVKGPAGQFGNPFGRKSSVTTELLSATGEASFTPPQANIQVSFLGLKFNERVIGTTLYLEEPFIARVDGGRPWVEERNQNLEQSVNLGASTPGGGAGGAGSKVFAKTIETLNAARSIHEVGQVTVDDQPTTAFKASVEVDRIGKPTRAQTRVRRKLLRPLIGVEIFIAESGVPVRTIVRLEYRGHHGGLIVQSDILAVNVPVVVQAPPADKTISQARLDRLLARRLVRHVRGGSPKSEDPESK